MTNQTKQVVREITLEDLYLKCLLILKFLWGYKGRLLLVGIVGGGFGFGFAHVLNKTNYKSRLTFAIEEKGGGSALSGIASQFGFDLGGAGSSAGLFSSDNVILLLRSNRIVQEALLRPLPVFENQHLLNKYLEVYHQKDIQKGKLAFIDPIKQRDYFNRREDSTLNLVTDRLVKKCIHVVRLDKKAAIIAVEVTTRDEQLSYWLSKLIIDQATELYLELKVGKTRQTVRILEQRVDSVRRELDMAMNIAATQNDQNQALVLMRGRVPAVKKQMEVQMLTTLFSELTKNLELTKFTLEREEPVMEVIDAPSLPLEKIGRKRVITSIVFSILSVLAAAVYFFLKSWSSKNIANSDS